MAQIIDGKAEAQRVRDETAAAVAAFCAEFGIFRERRPRLVHYASEEAVPSHRDECGCVQF